MPPPDQFQQTIAELYGLLAGRDGEIGRLKAELEDLSSECDGSSNLLDEAEAANSDLSRQLSAARSGKSTAEAELVVCRGRNVTVVDELRRQLAEKDSKLAAAEAGRAAAEAVSEKSRAAAEAGRAAAESVYTEKASAEAAANGLEADRRASLLARVQDDHRQELAAVRGALEAERESHRLQKVAQMRSSMRATSAEVTAAAEDARAEALAAASELMQHHAGDATAGSDATALTAVRESRVRSELSQVCTVCPQLLFALN